MSKKYNKKWYNKTNTCENIKKDGTICGKILMPGNVCREYNKEGDWTGRWLCKTCGIAQYCYGVYNKTNTCEKIKENGEKCMKQLIPGKALREIDENWRHTGRWICHSCGMKDYRKRTYSTDNIKKSVGNRRTGNQNPNSSSAKGDFFQKLINILRNLIDLNEKDDNYMSPIDSIDPITGLKYHIKGRLYDSRYGYWNFAGLEKEWKKEFVYMFCCCASEDGKIIERIYEIPKEEIVKRKGISIVKNPSRGNQWYEQYRIKDEEEIKKANEIWNKIIKGKRLERR